MIRLALVNDNQVVDIVFVENESDFTLGHLYQQVIDTTDFTYKPNIGWKFSSGVLFREFPDLTPKQLRQILFLNGVGEDMILASIGSLDEPLKTLVGIAWSYAIGFSRKDPLLAQVAQSLGLSEESLDNLWEAGLKL